MFGDSGLDKTGVRLAWRTREAGDRYLGKLGVRRGQRCGIDWARAWLASLAPDLSGPVAPYWWAASGP